MRRSFLKKAAVTTLALTLGASVVNAKQANWPKELNFGVVPVAESQEMHDIYGKLATYLQKELGVKVKLVIPNDYAGVIVGMAHKHIDIGYFGPKSYCEASKRAGAEASVLGLGLKTGTPGYYGYVITKKGSGLKTLADIKGKKWAFTDPNSTSGTLVPSVMFANKGINPQKYFSRVLYSGNHEASILSVKNGKVDAASTNNHAFARGLGKFWTKDDFNIIWKSKLIPGSPVSVRKDLPESLKMAIKGALISYDDKTGLEKMKIQGFAPAKDSMYDGVREMIKFKNSLKKKS